MSSRPSEPRSYGFGSGDVGASHDGYEDMKAICIVDIHHSGSQQYQLLIRSMCLA